MTAIEKEIKDAALAFFLAKENRVPTTQQYRRLARACSKLIREPKEAKAA